MVDTHQLRRTLAEHNEEGQLYVLVGLLAAFAALLVPILGVVAVACGYRLVTATRHRLVGALVAALGAVSLVYLLLMMAAVL